MPNKLKDAVPMADVARNFSDAIRAEIARRIASGMSYALAREQVSQELQAFADYMIAGVGAHPKCEGCGAQIAFGTLCAKCKAEVTGERPERG